LKNITIVDRVVNW